MNRIDAHGLKFQDEASGRFCYVAYRVRNLSPHTS